mgnify:CR=1 FL=1
MAVSKTRYFIGSAHADGSTDPLREGQGKYWVTPGNARASAPEDLLSQPEMEYSGEDASWSDNVSFHMSVGDAEYDSEAMFYKIKHKIKLMGRSDAFADNDNWASYVTGTIVNTTDVFEDCVFDLESPFSKQELESFAEIGNPLQADIEPSYNFYIESYENKLNTRRVPEQLLPNLYAFMFEKEGVNLDSENTAFNQLITLNGNIPDVYVDVTNQKGEKIGEKDEGEYYQKYAYYYDQASSGSSLTELKDKYSRIGIPISDVGKINEYNQKAELFPMYSNIVFSTDKLTTFAQILSDAKLSTALIRELLESKLSSSGTMSFKEAVEVLHQHTLETGETKVTRTVSTEIGQRKVYDLLSWWSNYNSVTPTAMSDEVVMLTNDDNQVRAHSETEYSFEKNMGLLIFAGKLRTFIKNSLRTYGDITAGTKAHSETVMYRIEKRLGHASGPVLQNFFIPNSNDIDIFTYIDTQVGYARRYTYNIYAYQLVVGSQYRYSNVNITEIAESRGRGGDTEDPLDIEYTANLEVEVTPTLKLVETPYFTESEVIMDDPPLAPDIQLIPYKGINNRILLTFNNNVGEYYFHPIMLDQHEEQIINTVRQAQKIPDTGKPIRYKGDDHAQYFEVLRLRQKPKKWADFLHSNRRLVATDISKKTKLKAGSAAMIDKILPNQKYYYIFRTWDIHNKISNPSPIYELEIVDDGGVIFPVVKVVEFAEPIPKMPAKTMKRYVMIQPKIAHAIINESKSNVQNSTTALDSNGEVYLGTKDEDIWDKKFKIRFTSKDTGKKYDVNVQFNYEHVAKE